jgi:hypothetical protein
MSQLVGKFTSVETKEGKFSPNDQKPIPLKDSSLQPIFPLSELLEPDRDSPAGWFLISLIFPRDVAQLGDENADSDPVRRSLILKTFPRSADF